MEVRVYSPTAILGYGFPVESLERAVGEEPDVIAVDGGSADPGPYYLGEGVSFTSWRGVVRDLRLLLSAARRLGVPLVVGSAGGAGARPHVEWALRALGEAASRLGVRVRVGVAYTDVDPGWLARVAGEGSRAMEPPVDPGAALASARVVAQVGVEPFAELLRGGYDVVLVGRSVDVASFAALPWLRGADRGLAVHMGKVLECGAIAAEPGSGSDGMMGVLRRGEFEVYPVNPSRRATVLSVAEHALYERSDPYRECIPGGCADLSAARYEEGARGVVVRGTRWVDSPVRMVKVEGARLAGHRVIVVAGARDPGFIERLDSLIGEAVGHARRVLGFDFRVHVRVYGRDGVMGPREPTPTPAHEVGLLIEVVAGGEEEARAAAALVRSTLLHAGWPGRRTTAGNLAFPLSPSDVYAGRAYEWSVWSLVEERHPLEFSRLGEEVAGG